MRRSDECWDAPKRQPGSEHCEGLADLWVHPVDRHPNGDCNRLSARALARELRRMELVP